MATVLGAGPPSQASIRMRRHRERRSSGLRCITLQIRDSEIEVLVGMGLLAPETRNDPHYIREALYAYLDRTLGGAP